MFSQEFSYSIELKTQKRYKKYTKNSLTLVLYLFLSKKLSSL